MPSLQQGMTLIELMIGLIILSIMVGLAVPAFGDAIERRKIAGLVDEVQTRIAVARSEAIKRNQGVGFIPAFVCREALAKGDVVEVLADSQKPNLTLYALYPARHFVPSRLVQCIEYLEQWFADTECESVTGPP